MRKLLFAASLLGLATVSGCQFEPQARQLDITEQVSPKGFHFSLAKSDMQDAVSISVAFACGLICDGQNQYAAGFLAPAVARHGGTKSLGAPEIFESFKDSGAGFRFSANSDQTYVDLSAPSRGIESAVKLANGVFTSPLLPESMTSRAREQSAKQREENSLSANFLTLQAFIHAGVDAGSYDHYFAPRAEDIRSVQAPQLAAWLHSHLSTKGVMVAVMGDITPDRAGKLVDQLLQNLPDQSTDIALPQVSFKTQNGEVVRIKGDGGGQAVVNFGSINVPPQTLKEWISGYMLAKIFADGSKSRLFADVREKIGATYGLELDFNFYEKLAMNRVVGRLGTTKLDVALNQMRQSWKDFRDKGPTDAEVAEAKAAMFNELNNVARDNERGASTIRDYLTGHWSSADIANLPNLIASADLKDQTLLNKLFPANPIVVVAE